MASTPQAENICVAYCVRRVTYGTDEMHLHAPPHGLFVNIWGPARGDDIDEYLARTTYHTLEEAQAAFDKAEAELLA